MTADPALHVVARPVDTTEPDLDAVVHELRAVLDAIRAVHRALADHPDPHGPGEAELDRLREQRAGLEQQVGVAVARLLASGGSVVARGLVVDVVAAGDAQGGVIRGQEEPAASEGLAVAPEPVAEDVAGPKASNHDEPLGQVDALDGLEDPELTPTIVDDIAEVLEPVARTESSRVASSSVPPRAHLDPAAARPKARSTPAPAPARKELPWLLDAIGRPSPVILPGDATSAVDRLLAATAELDAWLVYPSAVQQAFTGLVSAIARHVQDEAEVDLPPNHRDAMRSWFSAMTHWSKLQKPGFVPGLSRKNGPEYGSWIDDAEHWWRVLTNFAAPKPTDAAEAEVRPWTPPRRRAEPEPVLDPGDALREVERAAGDPQADLAAAIQLAVDAGVGQRDPMLLRALQPYAERVSKVPGLKTLKTALKAAARVPAATVGDEDVTVHDAPSVPEDWPFLALTQRKHAVVAGGDRRPDAADRIREAFGFVACVWEDTEPRRVAALASRIRARSVDVVILLKRYISHSEMDLVVDACKDSDTPFAVVEAGYGVAQVRLAIERYLKARVPG